MDWFSVCVPQNYSMPALLVIISRDDSSLTRTMICLSFMLLEKTGTLPFLCEM